MDLLSDEEIKAVSQMRRLEKSWPKSLWLFSASGSLCIMKKCNGQRVILPHGGVDPDWEVETIKIENDGGDW